MVGGEVIGIGFVSTVVCDHPRLGVCRMDACDYDPDTCGAILSGPDLPPIPVGKSDPPNFNPLVDANGNVIADEPGSTTPL